MVAGSIRAPLFGGKFTTLLTDVDSEIHTLRMHGFVPSWVIEGAPIYADFASEGDTNHYWANGAQRAGFEAWLTALGGTFTRASTKWVMGSNGLLTSVASGALAIEYDINGIPIGALQEGARTNLWLRSQEFDNGSWTKSAVSISANSIAAPDGTTTADTLVEDGTTDLHSVIQFASLTDTVVYTASVYAKAKERSRISICEASTTGAASTFDLSAGTVLGNQFGGAGSIEDIGNGWYRCSMTFTAAATGSQGFHIALATGTTFTSYAGDGASGVYIWGAQLEALSHASSYIPTTTGTVTRAADSLSLPWASDTASLFIRTKNLNLVENNNYLLNFTTGVTSHGIAAQGAQVLVAWNGAQAIGDSAIPGTWLDDRRSIIAGSPSARSTSVNGRTVVSDANKLCDTPTALYLGSLVGPSLHLEGHLVEFAAWPGIKLSDAALEALTS